MIKLFRQIRKSLLMENRTSKYFKYAIGEIILVVIGILIALQINNWNENRKLNASELILLKDISKNLKSCLTELESTLKFNQLTFNRNKLILNHLDNKLPYSKKLDSAFVTLVNWSSPYFTFTAYETLKSKGIDIIKNDSIKQGIIEIYESDYAYLVKDYDQSEWVLAQSVVFPTSVNHIRKIDDNTSRPNDYKSLQSNNQFKNMIGEILDVRKTGIIKMQHVVKKTEKLLKKIESEINSRN